MERVGEIAETVADYKFLNSEAVDYLTGGTIKVSSLSYYRKLEAKRRWIADSMEGTVVVDIDRFDSVLDHSESPWYRPEWLTPEGFSAFVGPTRGRVTFEDVEFSYSSDEVFILSLARGTLAALVQVMRDSTSENPYDACVRITDVPLLAHRMFYSGTVLEMENIRLRKLFTRFQFEAVRYDEVVRNPGMGRPPAPTPFLKDKIFAQQNEMRIVFYPRREIPLERFTVKIPRPDKLLVEVFRNYFG